MWTRSSMGWHGGTSFCWSGCTVWPLLTLAVTALGLGIAISSSNKCRKMASLNENCYPIEGEDGSEKEDRISQLPDDLLCEILSRLHLQEAAKTSILGRRWRNIWARRSTLVLDCAYLCGGMSPHKTHRMLRFVNAVDQTFRSASSHKIKYAHICCCFAKNIPSDFSRWVQHLMCSGVAELKFLFFCSSYSIEDDKFAFPFDLLFQAVSLKRLVLFSCALKRSFKGHFRSLEHLHLSAVQIDNEDVPNILSSCVNLQWFVLKGCKLPTNLWICGPCVSLKFLEIDTCHGVRLIDLKAVNLTTFICFSFYNIEYKLSCVPKLEQISVRCCGAGMVPYIFGEVAKCCPDLKTMLFQTMIDKLQYLPVKISLLNKLVHLELMMFFEFRADLINIIPILGACPVLEKFHLLAIESVQGKLSEARWPTLCYRHLKEVKFSGFHGMRNEIEFASFLVRSAPMLEQMLIQPYYEHYETRTWMNKVATQIDTEEGRLICDELSRQAASHRVEVCFGRNRADRYAKKEHPESFLPIFSELDK